jgi:hypothetical protein
LCPPHSVLVEGDRDREKNFNGVLDSKARNKLSATFSLTGSWVQEADFSQLKSTWLEINDLMSSLKRKQVYFSRSTSLGIREVSKFARVQKP